MVQRAPVACSIVENTATPCIHMALFNRVYFICFNWVDFTCYSLCIHRSFPENWRHLEWSRPQAELKDIIIREGLKNPATESVLQLLSVWKNFFNGHCRDDRESINSHHIKPRWKPIEKCFKALTISTQIRKQQKTRTVFYQYRNHLTNALKL